MIFSLALILLLGMFLGWLCKKIHFPSLFGMIVTGIVLGPYVLNVVDVSILNASSDLRRIALIIILIRAGLSLNVQDLKKVGRPAILMCFLPACFEMVGMVILAPIILNISILDAAILGAVIAAVSPAVIVPKMLKLMDDGYGTKKGIPQMILAGASVDDVFVIVMFSTFTGLAAGVDGTILSVVNIPVSIVIGVAFGILLGFILAWFFKKIHIRDTVKVIILLSFSFLTVTIEDQIGEIIPFASLIGVMCVGIGVNQCYAKLATRLSDKFNKIWVLAEIMLFVLVGTTVDIRSLTYTVIPAIILIGLVLLFRMAGVFICVLGTKLNMKERTFCMLAYLPKATVQAAIGGVPYAMGLGCGNVVLTTAVVSILFTAPLGAFLIELTYKKLLEKN